jgi:hypothetical protein
MSDTFSAHVRRPHAGRHALSPGLSRPERFGRAEVNPHSISVTGIDPLGTSAILNEAMRQRPKVKRSSFDGDAPDSDSPIVGLGDEATAVGDSLAPQNRRPGGENQAEPEGSRVASRVARVAGSATDRADASWTWTAQADPVALQRPAVTGNPGFAPDHPLTSTMRRHIEGPGEGLAGVPSRRPVPTIPGPTGAAIALRKGTD